MQSFAFKVSPHALGELSRNHMEPDLAAKVLESLGLSIADLKMKSRVIAGADYDHTLSAAQIAGAGAEAARSTWLALTKSLLSQRDAVKSMQAAVDAAELNLLSGHRRGIGARTRPGFGTPSRPGILLFY